MTWRPVSGEIVRFDTQLASVADIEEFFARHKVVARGGVSDDVYQVEVAITGRRKRVAVLQDATEDTPAHVVPGFSLAELVETMDKELRKVEIDIGGEVAWGNIDLGEVDVTMDAPLESDAALENGTGGANAEGTPSGADVPADAGTQEEETDGGQGIIPEFFDGPMLQISRVALSEVPSVAAAVGHPVAVVQRGGAVALVADVKLPERSSIFASGFSIELSSDPTGVEPPVLSVWQNYVRRSWAWQGELPLVPWVESNPAAYAFAEEQLGAGAFVTRICADLPDADAAKLRSALLGAPDTACRGVIEAMKFAPEVADCLEGLLEARLIPDAKVFEPKPLPRRLQSTVAYEVSGSGRAGPHFWKLYRKLFLDHPRALEVVASVEAGIGVLLFTLGAHKWKGRGPKLLMIAGSALTINAGTRILITQWIQAALENEGLSSRPESSAHE
jgi:hypothetical protein